MSFAMSDLRIIEGGKHRSPAPGNLTGNRHQADDMQFGAPPSLLTGIITATFGAGAAVISLLVYFEIWRPEPYISQQWLVFVFAGAIIGFFLRLERAIEAAANPSRCVEASRR
jgi:hypothetical protein